MKTQGKDGRAALLERAIRLKRASARRRDSELPSRPLEWQPRLGEMQRSLWLQHRLEPASAAYHLTSAFRVVGNLDLGGIERSVNGVIARTRLLRSTFRFTGDRVLQMVHEDLPIGLERIPAHRRQAAATAAREARKPFDLETGPLLRLLLVEEPAGSDRLLVLVLHHILADERSLGVFWNAVLADFERRASADRAQAGSADREPQFDDYVFWTATRGEADRAAGIAFWRERLEPPPEDLELPFERAGGEVRTPSGRLLSAALSPEVSAAIRRVASIIGTTPFALFAYAFRLLLHRYTEGRDVAFATPASTRSHPATAEMIGYFLNPVVIRASIDEERRAKESIRDFSAAVLRCLAQASVPFDVLVEELSPPRTPNRHPIFQTMFVYREPALPLQVGDARLDPFPLDLGESKFDLTVFASHSESACEISVEYRADRFEEVWMRKLLAHYTTLLANLEDHLESPVFEISMLSAEEDRVLRAWAQGPPPASVDTRLLPRKIRDRAGVAAGATAVIGGGTAWSYGELERSASAIARDLWRRGVRPGDRVGLFLDRSPQMIAGILGCHWAGAAYVPVDTDYPRARNQLVLEDAGVAAVLTHSADDRRLPALEAPSIPVDDSRDGEAAGLGDRQREPRRPGEPDAPDLDAPMPAYVLYTSGSTGRPKGVVVTHGNLRASVQARRETYEAASERFLLLPSVAFDSSVAGIFWTLSEGGTLVLPTESEVRDPKRLAGLIEEQRVTGLLCVPSLYRHILRAGGRGLRHLDTVIVAGESCPPQLVNEHFSTVPEARLFNEYGPTEATVWATVQELRPEDSGGTVPIGRPIAGVRLEVLDARRRPVPSGVSGEGWISGPTVAQGYWRRPDLTAERFVEVDSEFAERKFRTGDRLAWTADGRLTFRGRIDEQIKLRGFRIEPGEVEALLLEIAGIEEAAVVVREPEQLVAFVATRGAIENARERLERRLPGFMVPSRIVELAELPRLPNGKVDRARLRELPLDPVAPGPEKPQLLGGREQALVSLWEGLLGREGIRTGDNFFQLGGHSLAVVEMTVAIEKDFGVALAPADVFQNPTIRELAARIEQEGGPGAPAYAHLFPIEPGGRKAPFVFCVPHFFSGMVASRFRGERPVYGMRGVGLRPEGNRGRWRTMRDLGLELVAELRRRFPGDDCILAGYSFGASMAVEVARLLEERGTPARRLILIAPMPLDFLRLGPFRLQLDGLRRPVGELSLGRALRLFARQNHPFRSRGYRRAWRLFAIQPWRRLLCLTGKVRTLAGLPLTSRILHADVRVERFRLHAAYRPGVLRTPTVVFNAREPETDAAATWRPHFEGPFDVHEIADPHLGGTSIASAKERILHELRDLED